MSLNPLPAQVLLAAVMLISVIGTYMASSPPNPNSGNAPSTGDLLSSMFITQKHTTEFIMWPLPLLALHAISLVLYYPDISSAPLCRATAERLNTSLVTWSPQTITLLSLILFAGIPLRLIAYSSLGKNFTFALSKPDRLITDGIHRYLQHPSYTGIVILVVCNVALYGNTYGAASCWLPENWYHFFEIVRPTTDVIGISILLLVVWTRVKQEERMLQAEFGAEWERWNAKTPRFIPWVV